MTDSQRWLQRTRQTWKVTIYLVGLVGFGGVLTYCLSLSPESVGWTILATAGGMLSFVWLAVSVRCPECGARVAWFILRTAPANQWRTRLTNLTDCPRCESTRADTLFRAFQDF